MKLNKVSEININCKGVKLESNPNFKYLGMVIDQDMSVKTTETSIIKR